MQRFYHKCIGLQPQPDTDEGRGQCLTGLRMVVDQAACDKVPATQRIYIHT